MKENWLKKLLGILLSGILIITSLEAPAVYASEESVQTELSTEIPTESETDSAELQSETEMDSSETYTEQELASTEVLTEEILSDEVSDTDESQSEITSKELSTEELSDIDETEISKETASESELPKYSMFVVNPLYEGLIDTASFETQEETLTFLTEPRTIDTFQNVQEAAEYLRGQMVARENTVIFNIPTSLVSTQEKFSAFIDDTTKTAMAYTDSCTGQEGDALQWGYRTYGVNASGNTQTYQLTFTFTYHTTAEQEQQLTAKVDNALSSMKLSGKSDYEKITAIHDYICDHVDYDYSLQKFSAYDALCTGTAVCQGYATLFYRMCKDTGLSVRIISGIGNGGAHGWNIVKIGTNTRTTGKYYNVDCTWDGQDSNTYHTYLLKSEAEFADHKRDADYDTAAFHEAFPMAESSYVPVNSMNVDNILGTFFVYDGDNDPDNDVFVNTTANGKPKILVFIQTTCPRSQATVRDIAKNDFGDVDLYVISTLGEEGNAAFASFINQNASGNDQITFAYQGNRAWNDYFALAEEYADWSGLEETPMICYIDANNKLQYMTHGQQTANTIRNNINTYCGSNSEPTTYVITYILNGGTNNTNNPSAYTSDSDTITLSDPVRQDYTFAGWYTDAAFTQKITQIVKGSTGDLTLYAKWERSTQEPPDTLDFPQVDMTLTEGNIIMGISGAYYTETAETILKRLNEIRLEACKEGVIDPATQTALTEADYKPLKWSSDLEAIARMRAAEASVRLEHTRPNGKNCFSARTTNNESSWAENLAWNYTNLMAGIEQWYGEKADWVNQTPGKVTGHYTSIISTNYNYVAVSAFKLKEGSIYPVSVAQEFSYKATMDSQKSDITGDCIQDMEIVGSAVSKLTFESGSPLRLEAGSSHIPALNATIGFEAYGKKTNCTGPVREGGTWKSSDETVAIVDANGNITAVKGGKTTITVTVGTVSANIAVEVFNEGDNPLQLTKPAKTVYKLGEKLDLTGGSVTYEGKTITLSQNMISGFQSDTTGISKVTVTYNGYITDFDTLIIQEPRLSAKYGQTLSQLTLPTNEHGTWNWADTDLTKKLEEVGTLKLNVSFTPNDLNTFQKREDLQAEVTVHRSLEDMGVTAQLSNTTCTYNGSYQAPKVKVLAGGKDLILNEEYTLTYQNNKNVGTGIVLIEGKGNYEGSIIKTFEITPAKLVITAKNSTASVIDIPTTFEYEVEGLVTGEALVTEPKLTCNVPMPVRAGIYDIMPSGAKATSNYDSNITYVNGHLILSEESVAYIVTFDVQGHGAQPASFIGKAGGVITQPTPPAADGYTFAGWYQDITCTKAWNFETDIIQSDITLYAKWLVNSSNSSFRIQEIADIYYTGKACKPAVSVYDGNTLLTANKDYTISYKNNINVNSTLDTQPSITITGKGNYKDSLTVNFSILPAPIADEQGNPVHGAVLNYTDQIAVSTKKNAAPFKSIKFGKTLKKDVDFELSIIDTDTQQKMEGGVIPAGKTGTFELEIKGIGNYTGTICQTVYVLDQSKLLKNAKITLGKNIKSVNLKTYMEAQKKVEFNAAYYNKEDHTYYRVEDGSPTSALTPEELKNYFTVTCGGTSLIYQKDFMVSYEHNDRVGTASLIITGTGSQYAGEKAISFKITGEAFKANMVEINNLQTNMTFTGTALTQNNVQLTYKGNTAPLAYGKDYTISYKKNINKGTATMTFTATKDSVYSGSFSKTFKILSADISDMEPDDSIEVPYEKAGVKPVSKIQLKNPAGALLQYGRDYTISYKNVKAVAKSTDETAPTMTIKGKGNYTGSFQKTFTITESSFTNGNITIEIAPIAYSPQKTQGYYYKPSVKVKDGKSSLKVTKDYEVTYDNNSQEACKDYMDKLEKGETVSQNTVPTITITPTANSNYDPKQSITMPLPIYRTKLTASTLYIVPDTAETVYTGDQVCPTVKVYYNSDTKAITAAKSKLKAGTPLSETELTEKGFYLLRGSLDYTYSYGANISAGKNKGSIIIQGTAPNYGGTVTVKFDIIQKNITK